MASLRERNGKWQARVVREGYPSQVKSFHDKRTAEQWARSVEAEIDQGRFIVATGAQKMTLQQVIHRYIRDVVPTMKGARDDTIRLNALALRTIARYSLANLTPERVAEYRDQRLGEVRPGTVLRELAYLSSIINHARREWGLHIQNPIQAVRKPASPAGRSRILSADEQVRLLEALEPTGRRSIWTKPIAALALETGMRRGELLSLTWDRIDLTRQTAYLSTTKNGMARVVPLSTAAVRQLMTLQRAADNESVFPVKYFTFDAAFKRAVKRAGITDLRFHDLRHTAITNMAGKLPNIIELSAVSGHKSLAMLKRYYHPDPEALAKKLG